MINNFKIASLSMGSICILSNFRPNLHSFICFNAIHLVVYISLNQTTLQEFKYLNFCIDTTFKPRVCPI